MQTQANNIASLILLTLLVQTRSDSDGVLKNDSRPPRTQGRIVKQYAGVKRDPIQCTQEGFQADNYDCTIFYQCVLGNRGKYTVFRHQCGPGTIFDIEKSICNHPRSTIRSECGGWTKPPNLPTPENEVDIIEQEVFKSHSKIEPSKYSLTDFLHTQTTKDFSNVISNYQENLKKISHSITVQSFVESTQRPIYSFDWITKVNNTIFNVTSKQELETTTPTINKSEQKNKHQIKTRSDKICHTEGFIGDSENCHVFYRCVSNSRGGFIRYDYFCSESTIWDDEVQACNHIWAVKNRSCETRLSDGSAREEVNKIEKTSESGSVQKELQIRYEPKLTQSQTHISNDNVKQNKTQINNENKNSIESFEVSSQDQTLDSYGSAVTQLQTDYSNKGLQTQFQVDLKNKSSQLQTLTLEKNSKASPVNQYKIQSFNSNENICFESGFKGVKNDCKKFYRCVENGKGYTKYDYICGEGTVWDSQIESCNHIWAVKDCGENNNQNSISTTQSIISSTKTTQSYQTILTTFPIEKNDSLYNDESFQNQNIFSTSHTTLLTTKPENKSNTEESIKIEFICKIDGFFGDAKDCKKFYRCVDKGKSAFIKYEFKCGEGTVWDSAIEACNHAWAVKNCGQYMGSNSNSFSSTTPITNIMTTVSLITVSSLRPTQNEEYVSGYDNPQKENQILSSTVSSTTTQQHQFSICLTNGFFGDKDDCRKFYRCVEKNDGSYTRYEFTCGEGTVWDQKLESCNHEWAVPDCKSNIYNNSTQNETLSSTVTTTSNSINHEQNIEHSSSTKTTKTIISTTSTTKTTRPASNSHDSLHFECKQDGFMGDINDCRKFYRCVPNDKGGYNKYEFQCGEGTVWDQNIETCNYDLGNNKCIKSDDVAITSKPINEANVTQAESIILSTPTQDNSISTSTSKPQITQDECKSEGFFGNTDDCKKFYRCVNDDKGGYMKYDFTCSEGTVWVQEILACDHDNEINSCKSQNNNMGIGLQITTVSEAISSTTGATSSTTNDHENNDNIHENSSPPPSGKCVSDGFYPNEQDCKSFYRCVDNGNGGFTKYDFTCGEGTAWDSEIQSCNHISEVKGCRQSNTGSSSQSSDGQYSTTTHKTSTLEPNSECTMSSKDTCDQEGYYGNSNNCEKFYRCVDNGKGGLIKFDFTCGEGTIWDQDVLACNHPQDVANPSCKKNCSSTSSSTSQHTSSTLSSTEAASILETTSSYDTTSHISSETSNDYSKNPENQNITCSHAGFFANPNDCKKFYRCVDWNGTGEKYSIFYFECGDGTIWDPALETCNYEESVYPSRDCGHIQNENNTVEGTTISTTKTSTTSSGTTSKTQKTTTTTQQSTSQKTSTTTTSEKTTTQETMTTEKTTPKQETTLHQAVTESTFTQPTTTEQTTIQQLMTTEPSTTQQPTTTESTTTQQPTELTTTQQTKTDKTTTQQATTETTTTEISTTQQSTPQENSIEQSTTEGTTQESTTYQQPTTDGNSESTTESLSSSNECPEINNDQYLLVCPTSFRRHPKYCNLFYQCLEDDDTHEANIATFRCPNNTIYDENKIQCIEENKADKKCEGQNARRLKINFKPGTNLKESIIVGREGFSCTNEGHLPFEKRYECSTAFLKCQKLKSGDIKGFVYQCPPGYVYWSISRRCELSRKIINCRRSFNDWDGRWSIPIERTNIGI